MASSKIEIPEELKSYKGPFGLAAVMTTLATIVLNLPDDYILKLNERWLIITVPSVIFLLGAFGQAYLAEQKHRTQVEEHVSSKLSTLTEHIQRIFDNRIDEKIYMENRFDTIDDGQKKIFLILEKRKDYIHQGDTEKFLNGNS